jgi:hypothetical protein
VFLNVQTRKNSLESCTQGGGLISKFIKKVFLFLLGLLSSFAFAEFTIDVYTGTSFYQPSWLEISQEGYETVVVDGVQYRTNPWSDFPNITGNYFGVRYGYFPERSARFGIELEHLHSKAIYTSGNDPEGIVQHFEVTDGMNFVMVNGVFRLADDFSATYPFGADQLLFRVGVGPTISKPASTIRGQADGYENTGVLLKGYALAGVGGQVAMQYKRFVLPWLAYSFEYKFTYTHATVPIAEGSVVTPLAAGHVVFGLSFVF